MVFVVSHMFRGHSATQFFDDSQVIQAIGVSNFAPFLGVQDPCGRFQK